VSRSVRTLLRGAQPGAGAAKAPPRHHAGAKPRGVRLEAAVLGRHAGDLQKSEKEQLISELTAWNGAPLMT
jgi:hypothetical protein